MSNETRHIKDVEDASFLSISQNCASLKSDCSDLLKSLHVLHSHKAKLHVLTDEEMEYHAINVSMSLDDINEQTNNLIRLLT